MGLLSNLGLKPSKAMLRRAMAANAPRAADVKVDKAVAVGADAKVGSLEHEEAPKPGAEALDPARAAALALKPRLRAEQSAAAEECRKLGDGQKKLDALLAKLPAGAQKAELEGKKKLLAKRVAEAEERLEQAGADLEAVDDPATRREALVALLARRGSKAKIEEVTEIDEMPGLKGQKLNERKTATTTTASDEGGSTSTREEDSVKVGFGTVTKKHAVETTTTDEKGTLVSGRESEVTVGKDGVKKSEKTSVELEREGKKSKFEREREFEVGPDGVKRSVKTTYTDEDGSSQTTSRDEALERGEGKFGAAKGGSTTRKDAQGNEVKRGAKGSGGLLSGEDGQGVYGKGEGEVSRKGKSGLTAGAVGSLHANVSCNIGKPAGEPPVYPLTLQVNLGAEITLSAGHDKKDAAAKGGFSFTGGADVVMKVTRQLGAGEAQEYVQALQEISAGGQGAGTYREFAIIHAGIENGWAVAQAMFQGGGKTLSPEMIAALKHAGDSIELTGTRKKGAKGKVEAKVVSLDVGIDVSEEDKGSVTRNEDGTLDASFGHKETTKGSVKVGVNSGLVGGVVGRGRTVQTSFGIDITVDPKRDPENLILQQLQACHSAADFEAFIKKNKAWITVKSQTTGKALSDSEMVGLKLGVVEASIGLHAGVAEEKVVDADGKLIRSTVVGTAGGGGGVKGGDVAWGDGVEDEAVAQRDGEGNASLDLTRTRSQTTLEKLGDWAKEKLHLGDESEEEKKKKKARGVLGAAAGGEKKEVDTQAHDVFGLKLGPKDLQEIARRAENEGQWLHAAQRAQEYEDWRQVSRKIRASGGDVGVVAEELARFIGGDKINRLDMVKRFLRPGGDTRIGKASSFPDSLAKLREDYEKLIETECEKQVAEAAKKLGPQQAGELGQKLFDRVEKLRIAVSKAEDFSDRGAQAEMMSEINRRRMAILAAMREAAGKTSEDDRKKAAEEAFNRLIADCHKYSFKQDELFERIRKLKGSREFILVADFKEGESYVNQLADVRSIWLRDLKEAAAQAKLAGLPDDRWQGMRPNDTEFERLKKACYK